MGNEPCLHHTIKHHPNSARRPELSLHGIFSYCQSICERSLEAANPEQARSDGGCDSTWRRTSATIGLVAQLCSTLSWSWRAEKNDFAEKRIQTASVLLEAPRVLVVRCQWSLLLVVDATPRTYCWLEVLPWLDTTTSNEYEHDLVSW